MSPAYNPKSDSEHVSMELNDWWPWYERIAAAFRFSREQDQTATDLLSQLLQGRASPVSEFFEVLNGRKVIVFGAGPSLEADLTRLNELHLINRYTTLAADGATTALLKVSNKLPDIIVSDLDGPTDDLIACVKKGSKIVIHGHGDNIAALKVSVPSFNKALGSTQVEPRERVYNFGGFTDGDRAVFLAEAMEASTIVLAGMDFGTVIGKYSKPKVTRPDIKIRKLQFGKTLLEWLAGRGKAIHYNITRNGEQIAGFRFIEPERLAEH